MSCGPSAKSCPSASTATCPCDGPGGGPRRRGARRDRGGSRDGVAEAHRGRAPAGGQPAGLAVLGPVVAAPQAGRGGPPEAVTVEVTTVADDEAVLFDGADWTRIQGLDPDHDYTVLDQAFRTLP